MDLKDRHIQALQMELTRQRNLVAERDSIIQSYESEMESWRDGVLAGFISLEDHYSEIEDARKESAKEVSQIKAELDAERNARMAAEARVRELEEAASEREEAHKEELAKFGEVQEMAEKAKEHEIDMMSIVRVIQNRMFNHNSDRMRFLNSQLDIDDETVREQGFEAILQSISKDADEELNGVKEDAGMSGQDETEQKNE